MHASDRNSNTKTTSRTMSSLERCSVASTVLRVPDAGVVVVPLTVFSINPNGVSNAFSTHNGEIVYEEWVNVMMHVPGMKKSRLGNFDDLSHTWTTRVDNADDVDRLTSRLSRYPTFLCLTLIIRKILGENTEIPMVVCIQPKASCMEKLVEQLQSAKKDITRNKNFYFEVDVGRAVVNWASEVLVKDFACLGGRFGVTNAEPFNHLWDWQSILGCLPCLCCCLLGGCFYRCHRCLWYRQDIRAVTEKVVVMGSTDLQTHRQRQGLETLINWTKSAGGNICGRCGLGVTGPVGDRCTCVKRIQERQPLTLHAETKNKQRVRHSFDGISWFDLETQADSDDNKKSGIVTPSNVDVDVHADHGVVSRHDVKHVVVTGTHRVERSKAEKPSVVNKHLKAFRF